MFAAPLQFAALAEHPARIPRSPALRDSGIINPTTCIRTDIKYRVIFACEHARLPSPLSVAVHESLGASLTGDMSQQGNNPADESK